MPPLELHVDLRPRILDLVPQLDQAVDVTVILGKDFDGRYVK